MSRVVSNALLIVGFLIAGCEDENKYYDPYSADVVSNRAEAIGLVNIAAPKLMALVSSYEERGRYDISWEFRQLMEEDVRDQLIGLVDIEFWNVASNKFTKLGIDYLKTTQVDSRVPGMISHFALFEYNSILSRIENCIRSCHYSEAQEWDRYLQKIIANNRKEMKLLGDAVGYYSQHNVTATNAQILAWSMAGEPYYSKRMCPSMTLGQILTNPNELLAQQARNFQKKGLSLEVVTYYYFENRPEEFKRLFDWFLPVGLEIDGTLKNDVVRYRNGRLYSSNKGEFSKVCNTIANVMAKDMKRLHEMFRTLDDVARFMDYFYYEFYYASEKDIESKLNKRYSLLMDKLQVSCANDKITADQAFAIISKSEEEAKLQGR